MSLFPQIYGIFSQILNIAYLFRDQFTTPEAAPLTSPRTAEPGPGTAVIVDTNNVWSISGGDLVSAGGGTAAGSNDPDFRVSGLTQAAGLAHKFELIEGRGSATGFKTNAADAWNVGYYGILEDAGGDWSILAAGHYTTAFSLLGISYPQTFTIVLRAAGFILFVGTNLAYVFDSGTGLQIASAAARTTGFPSPYVGYFAVANLTGPLADDSLKTANLTGAVAIQTFTHTADFFINWTAANLAHTVAVREQDASNRWEIRIENSTGAVADLAAYEVVAGVPTLRGVSAGAVAVGDRIVVRSEGTRIRVNRERGAAGTSYNVVDSSFTTETTGRVITTGTQDLSAWPRVMTGNAKRQLEVM